VGQHSAQSPAQLLIRPSAKPAPKHRSPNPLRVDVDEWQNPPIADIGRTQRSTLALERDSRNATPGEPHNHHLVQFHASAEAIFAAPFKPDPIQDQNSGRLFAHDGLGRR